MSISYGPTVVATLNVKDFGAALAWYARVLGFETEYAIEGMGWGEIRTNLPGLTIGIQTDPASAGKQGGQTLTFSVTDIAAARAELEATGVQFDGETQEIPGMVKLATFMDPDGNRFMLAQTLQG